MPLFLTKLSRFGWFLLFFLIILVFSQVMWAIASSSHQWRKDDTASDTPALNNKKNFSNFSSNQLNVFNDICFINSKDGWIVGSNGRILQTTDGGNTWKIVPSGVTTNLLTVNILNAQNGWAAGEDGIILGWDGDKWSVKYEDEQLRIFDIQFSSSTNGIAMAGNRLLQTQNAGNSWRPLEAPGDQNLIGAHLFNHQEGWTFGGTANSEASLLSWNGYELEDRTPQSMQNLIMDMDFVTNEKGWLVGFGNSVLHTSDKGKTWHRQNIDTEKGLIYKIDFPDTLNGWIITQSGEIFKTKDGGRSWILNHKEDATLLGLQFIDYKRGWIVGSGGTILKTDNGGKSWKKYNFDNTLILSYLKGAYCIIANDFIREPKLFMHVPVISLHSSPITFELGEITPKSKFKSSRTIKKQGDNWLVEVTFNSLNAGDSVFVPYDSWILKRSTSFNDRPEFVEISALKNIPESVKPYLKSSKIAQSSNPEIEVKARNLSLGHQNLVDICDAIINFTGNSIQYKGGNEQEALTTLRNGYGVCNGKANLAVALFRSIGIPARILMVAKTHFIIEYYLPTYGWIRAESTSGFPIQPSEQNTVMWTASVEDEMASPYNGIVCYWGTNDRRLLYDILYDETEQNESVTGIQVTPQRAETLLDIAKSNWRQYNKFLNQNTSSKGRRLFDQAVAYHFQARQALEMNDIEEFSKNLEFAQSAYEQINSRPSTNSVQNEEYLLDSFSLMQNYPNPFNDKTLIHFKLPKAGIAKIRIFNIAGQEVATLLDEYRQAGIHNVSWNATDRRGQAIASGIYFYQLEFQGFVLKKEAIYLK